MQGHMIKIVFPKNMDGGCPHWPFPIHMLSGESVNIFEPFKHFKNNSRDLDGDGVPELICNSTYGDGVESVIVYRNNNGIIEEGNIRQSYYEKKFGWTHVLEGGISSLPVERYDPKQGVFTATDYYTRG